ncbi:MULTISPECIES: TIGR01244 family sulfur transferase [unclassified Ruegeria]|uniref:TIGR01244 family sulfur transferase n=1 Tax=unclassified Ruegeria TaxID=2625375 RepID=UPI001488371E|nr:MULTISPECIES: TIGR01244 family sulfur transferase [unclassified Ruegeria]NOD46940.1 TIGR01244 family phosphatase [Ruegeria sp. HKCCD5849]NOD51263.1 TIGR01244 family phosphatase [Ruegeria sp. HKCCD5851]NOD68082.1 TIGR01244 family phosphatase [Ruegeria sp. HKCCD7303]NOE33494.1 TIGR01244 family phosphatase [Ruegeria sp. HKCCD7318]
MEIRPITPRYAVSPQITVDDVPAIAAAGFVKVICNRPNVEVPPTMRSDAIGDAVRAAGMEYEVLELTHQTMTPENVQRQRDMAENCSGPVLAYCASGTRCSVIWALGQCEHMSTDDILTATTNAGYQLDGLRPALEQLRSKAG